MSVTSHPHPTYSWLSVHVRVCPRGHETRRTTSVGAGVEFPPCRCDALKTRARRKRLAEETPEEREARRQAREADARRRAFGPSGQPELYPWMDEQFAAVLAEHRLSLEELLEPNRDPRFVSARRDLAKRLFAGGATMTQIGRAIRRDWATCRALVHGVRR